MGVIIHSVIEAAEKAELLNLNLPDPASDGRFTTLNERGAMASHISGASEAFLLVACKPGAKVLEIGCAYGHVCAEALKRGAQNYTACDVEAKHLQILARQVKDLQPDKVANLILLEWNFPCGNLGSNSELMPGMYDAILAGNVLHFLTVDELRDALQKLLKLLKPEGQLFAEMTTPYTNLYRNSFIRDFPAKVENFLKADGIPPGFIYKNDVVDPVKISPQLDKELGLTNGHAFLFDKSVAIKMFEQCGFFVERCEYHPVNSYPWHFDGRESLYLTAKKNLN